MGRTRVLKHARTTSVVVEEQIYDEFEKSLKGKYNVSEALRNHMTSVVEEERKKEEGFGIEALPILSHRPVTQVSDVSMQSSIDSYLPCAIKVIAKAKVDEIEDWLKSADSVEQVEENIQVLRSVRQKSHLILINKYGVTLTREEQRGCVGMQYARR